MLSTVTLPIAIALWASTVLAAPPTTASGADGALCNKSVASNAVYPNSKANIDDRVSDLLNHMCWAEKVAQMGGVGGLLGDNSTYDYASYAEIAQLHNGTICTCFTIFELFIVSTVPTKYRLLLLCSFW